MRRILYTDVANAARAVMAAPPKARARLCSDMIRAAECADDHRLRTGHAHPCFGCGALEEVARRYPQVPEPGFDDPDFCAAFRLVLKHLMLQAPGSRRS
jgi:hypothetical protein